PRRAAAAVVVAGCAPTGLVDGRGRHWFVCSTPAVLLIAAGRLVSAGRPATGSSYPHPRASTDVEGSPPRLDTPPSPGHTSPGRLRLILNEREMTGYFKASAAAAIFVAAACAGDTNDQNAAAAA